jgi:hypothetical protein
MALKLMATDIPQELLLLGSFHAFGCDAQPKFQRQCRNGPDNRRAVMIR